MAGKANPRFDKALAFAAQVHGAVKQERKGTDFPYIAHPIRVAEILDRFDCHEDVIVAGFLHDTIEDANVTADEISAAFSPRIATIVTAVSEPDKSLPWKERKQHTLDQLEQEDDRDVLALVAADKLDNVRSITDTLRHLGHEKTWALFNAKRSDQYQVGALRYQLLHRTVSALIEARRYGAREALMLVHSFDAADSSLDAFQAFANALGLTSAVPNAITSSTVRGGVTLRLGWVKEC